MTIIKQELRQGKMSLLIWTAAIGFLLVICICIFPEIRGDMDTMGELFASMGSFTAAFSMDRLNIGTMIGFYSIECGNILGLGGALFAALAGVSILSKEEKDKTAEFLLTHPVSRARVATEKLAALLIEITAMDLTILALSLLSVRLIGENIPWKEVLLLHGAYFLLQIELAGVCFGISAFLRRSSAGIGLGLAVMLYFLNLIANMTDHAKFLKFITPFGYCEGADILDKGRLNTGYIAVGILFACIGIGAAYWEYARKDIH